MANIVFSQREENPTPPKPPDGGGGGASPGYVGEQRTFHEGVQMSFRDKNPSGEDLSNQAPDTMHGTQERNQGENQPLYGEWITVSRIKKGQKQKPSHVKSKGGKKEGSISNKFHLLQKDANLGTDVTVAPSKGKVVMVVDEEPKGNGARSWVQKRPRNEVSKPSNVGDNKYHNTHVESPKLGVNPHVTRKDAKESSSLVSTWTDGVKATLPLVSAAGNHFRFVDSNTSGSTNVALNLANISMEFCKQIPFSSHLKPPDPPSHQMQDHVEHFQDCVDGNSTNESPGDVIDFHPQVVTFRCFKGQVEWFASAVYANPVPTVRENLWDHLKTLGELLAHLGCLLAISMRFLAFQKSEEEAFLLVTLRDFWTA
ncbi:hypothetical protein SESBI_18005 [Sesbania bispinosa]|nr:hypothetical protein SESBI_18005 [Sesbania bispinosa]